MIKWAVLIVVSVVVLGLIARYFVNQKPKVSEVVNEPQAEFVIVDTPIPSPSLIPSSTRIPTIVLTTKPTVKAFSLDELFAKYGAQYHVDPGVLKKIAGCESGYDAGQITGDYAGLFQFASFAWIEARGRMGLPADQSLRFNAEESIRTAAFEINYKGTSGWSDCD